MMNYVHNMVFQKDNFPEIFSSYMLPISLNKKCTFRAKNFEYLYFLVDDKYSLIRHVNECFGLALEHDSSIVSAVVISFGYEQNIVSENGGILKISINHPYLELDCAIVFSHIIINDFLEKSYKFYSLVDKPLTQMTELQIRRFFKNYHFDTHNLTNYNNVLDVIACNRPMYSFSWEERYSTKRIFVNDLERRDGYSLLVISIINQSLMLKENEIIQKCVDGIMSDFLICGNEILEKHLRPRAFDINFIMVEKYLIFEKKFKQDLSLYFKDILLPIIRKYKKNGDDCASFHNLISNNSNILGIDNYVNGRLDEINNILEAI